MATSLSGFFTSLGGRMRAGMQLFLEEHGNKFAAQPVELVVEDLFEDYPAALLADGALQREHLGL